MVSIYALGTLPGRPRWAQGANFRPSWASSLLDAESGSNKIPKKVNFEDARNLKIELAPRRQLNFHIFKKFLPEPYKYRFRQLFWEPFGSFWLPFGVLGVLSGLPGSQGILEVSAGASPGSQGAPRRFQDPPRRFQDPPAPGWRSQLSRVLRGSRILFIC